MKKLLISSIAIASVCVLGQSFAFSIPGLPNMYVSAAYGYSNNDIPTPSADFKFNERHTTWGADAGLLMPVGPIYAGATVGYYDLANTTIENSSDRWTYKTHFFPVEAQVGFKFPHSITLSVDAGIAFTQQKLSHDVYNPPGRSVTNLAGSTSEWKKIVGARLSYRLPMGIAVGGEVKYLMGDKPKAFDANTPTGANDKAYRNIASETMFLATLSYQL